MKKGKLAAPIAVTALLCIWFGGWGITVFRLLPGLPLPVKLIGALIPLALVGVSVYVLVERIKEIRSGEGDDLDNY